MFTTGKTPVTHGFQRHCDVAVQRNQPRPPKTAIDTYTGATVLTLGGNPDKRNQQAH